MLVKRNCLFFSALNQATCGQRQPESKRLFAAPDDVYFILSAACIPLRTPGIDAAARRKNLSPPCFMFNAPAIAAASVCPAFDSNANVRHVAIRTNWISRRLFNISADEAAQQTMYPVCSEVTV